MARSRTRTVLWTLAAVIALAILPPAAEAGSWGSTSITIRLVGDGWGELADARSAAGRVETAKSVQAELAEKLDASEGQLSRVYGSDEARRILADSTRDAVVLRDGAADLSAVSDHGWIEENGDGTVYSL